MSDTLIVIDFETTGLYAGSDRVIEAAAVVLENGVITDRFQCLANPGFRIPSFIEQFTGITNAMVAGAPPVAEVMARFADFLGEHRLVAHNANFDRSFLTAELQPLRRAAREDFLCTLLLSRRIVRGLPSYKLAQVARHLGVTVPRQTHRALADAEMAANVLVALRRRLEAEFAPGEVDADLLFRAQAIQPAQFERRVKSLRTRP